MSNVYTDMTPVPVGKLSPKRPLRFDLRPSAHDMAVMADDLGLIGLRKVRFHGGIEADGKQDWKLSATLGATVIQPCVVTLDPVTTRLEEPITRRFLKTWPPVEEQGDEVEMPEDDSIDPLGEDIDLASVMAEALALALPVYPRIDGAEAPQTEARPAGAEPIGPSGQSAFSALADLKKKLEDGET